MTETIAAWLSLARDRLAPDGGAGVPPWWLLAAVAAVLAPPAWRWLRVVVTVVHELGHGLVGVLCGRRFTGLVLGGDMSGHAVTVGPSRGAGRVATTWAGYPAPALAGLAGLEAAAAGWAPPLLAVTCALLLGALLRVRSVYTALVVALLAGGAGVLWWWGSPVLQGWVVQGAGIFLVAGAWRHLAAVAVRRSSDSDPAVLARLTRVPAGLWLGSFVVVLGVVTWRVVTTTALGLDLPA